MVPDEDRGPVLWPLALFIICLVAILAGILVHLYRKGKLHVLLIQCRPLNKWLRRTTRLTSDEGYVLDDFSAVVHL